MIFALNIIYIYSSFEIYICYYFFFCTQVVEKYLYIFNTCLRIKLSKNNFNAFVILTRFQCELNQLKTSFINTYIILFIYI